MLGLIGRLTGVRFGIGIEHAEFLVEAGTVGPVVRVINYVTRENVTLGLAEDQLATEAGFAAQAGVRIALSAGGVSGSITPIALTAVRAGAAEGRSVSAFLGSSAMLDTMAVEMIAVPVGAVTFLYAARPAGAGLSIYRLEAAGDPVPLSTLADTAEVYLAGVRAMTSFTIGGQSYLVTGSRSEDGITVLAVGAAGGLSAVSTMGAGQMVPIAGVQVLRAVQAGGETYVIAAASGTSSLTVFRVGAGGQLTVTDQVMDTLDTRFQGVRCMDVITVQGRTFVLVAGADDGLTLMTLLPDGRLLHLETLADTADMALGNVTAVRMVQVGNSLQILTVSGAEAGVTVLDLDLGTLGQVLNGSNGVLTGTERNDLIRAGAAVTALSGGAGDDILIDGAGSQTLTGGVGADVFVLTPDGAADTILDFDISRDRIDLSLLPMFRNAGQLLVTLTSNGAVLRFGTEVLTIITANGRPLTLAQIAAMDPGTAMQRIVVSTGAPEEPEPEEPPPVGRVVHAGGGGADLLAGVAAGEDFLGHAGNDTFVGGGGADRFYGGEGFDIVSYAGLGQGIVLNLTSPASGSAEVTDDLFSLIEGVIGTSHGDAMTGDAAANWFSGGAGNDSIDGRGGDDLLFGGEGDDRLTDALGANRLEGGNGRDTLIAGAEADSLYGGAGDDVLDGGAGANLLDGGAGNDWIIGGAEDDIAYGGDGGDTLNLGAGNNSAEGGAGNDALNTGAGNDTLSGGAGNDEIRSDEGDDQVWGGDGNDGLVLGAGNDGAWGGAGNDTIAGGAGNDTIHGEDGDDSLGGGEGDDRAFGGNGADVIGTGGGQDYLDAGEGNNLVSGGWGRDTVIGGSGDENLAGSYDTDSITGGAGNDSIGGGAGNDTIRAGDGNDQIGAGDDDDLIYGEAGHDFLAGGNGHDTIFGDAGRDTLNGGAGNDVLTGDGWADTFVFNSFVSGERDRITDFEDGTERIRLVGAGGMSALRITNATLDGDSGAMIAIGGYRLFVEGVTASALDALDFLFY
jgi:Ca2+-binding RTX toxin-like protein